MLSIMFWQVADEGHELMLVHNTFIRFVSKTVSSKLYDKRDDSNFIIVNFPFLDGDVLTSLPMVNLNFAAYSFCERMF